MILHAPYTTNAQFGKTAKATYSARCTIPTRTARNIARKTTRVRSYNANMLTPWATAAVSSRNIGILYANIPTIKAGTSGTSLIRDCADSTKTANRYSPMAETTDATPLQTTTSTATVSYAPTANRIRRQTNTATSCRTSGPRL